VDGSRPNPLTYYCARRRESAGSKRRRSIPKGTRPAKDLPIKSLSLFPLNRRYLEPRKEIGKGPFPKRKGPIGIGSLSENVLETTASHQEA